MSDYCTERSNGIDPQRFLDYYEARGWRMGKSPVKNWKACVRTWENREKSAAPAEMTPQPSADALAYAAELEAEIRAKDPAHV